MPLRGAQVSYLPASDIFRSAQHSSAVPDSAGEKKNQGTFFCVGEYLNLKIGSFIMALAVAIGSVFAAPAVVKVGGGVYW